MERAKKKMFSLSNTAKSAPGVPENVQKLQNEAGIKLVLTNLEDPDR